MSLTKKIPAFLAGLTASLTSIDLALLIYTRSPMVWLFALVALPTGGLLTWHLLERAGLIGDDEE